MLRQLSALLVLVGCSDGASPHVAEVAQVAETPVRLFAEDFTDAPIAGLTDEELTRFEEGDARFEMPFQQAQGLGPLFIARSCTGCHEDDARGPGVVRRIVAVGHLPLPYGDTVRPRMTAGARTPLLAPEGAREAIRVPSAIFARGLIEAIPDATLLGYEAAQAASAEGISGRAARIAPETTPTTFGEARPRIGRFGHKARSASLDAFIADALLGDMGLTSPSRPTELPTPDGLDDDRRPGVDVGEDVVALLADYVRGVAMPRRDLGNHASGAALFAQVCEGCHESDARTRADHPVAALRDVDAAIYSDLLLHDMGEGLSDGIAEGEASEREWRTAPLIGIRHLRGLLHDGRAATVRDAVTQHASEGSEANASVARFDGLAPTEQDALVAFVEAL